MKSFQSTLPEILSPAGDVQCALAAFAAGADAVYLGLKHFSARMQAENFSTSDLSRLSVLARKENRRIYVAMNTLLKPNDTAQALRLIRRLVLDVEPAGLIVQDLGFLPLIKQAGFTGEIHFSTLSNVTHPQVLAAVSSLGVQRVVLPRELSYAEMEVLNDACPEELGLEVFIHGALCFCVSGRCWWSSYMGGKSGLRGRCVQPCRRVYRQKNRSGRFFSSLDLSLDSVAPALLSLPKVVSWKIEGRRKSPHYVYHVTSAYLLLRDNGADPLARKEAEKLLEMALGRDTTKSFFPVHFPQDKVNAGLLPGVKSGLHIAQPKDGQTGSGLLCGKIFRNPEGGFSFSPYFQLLAQDYIRIGYEDEPWHHTATIPRTVLAKTAFAISLPKGKLPKPGTPVFLLDRKDPLITKQLQGWQKRFSACEPVLKSRESALQSLVPPVYPRSFSATSKTSLTFFVRSSISQGKAAKQGLGKGVVQGLWLSPKNIQITSKTLFSKISWWLPPVIWPDEENLWQRLVTQAVRNGSRSFVCNSPWQKQFFSEAAGLQLLAGPFCNIANAQSIHVLESMGFSAAFISPELMKEDFLCLPGQSPLPLGIVLSGYIPMGISRFHAPHILQQEYLQSPKGESFWVRRYGQNTWIFPSWPLDLQGFAPLLKKAGYVYFAHLEEHLPPNASPQQRISTFNWDMPLL